MKPSTSHGSSTQNSSIENLYKQSSNSEKVEAEVNEMNWEDIGDGFYAVGKNGAYNLVFCQQIVSPKIFETREEAKKYKDKKPWELILIATSVYNERIQSIKK